MRRLLAALIVFVATALPLSAYAQPGTLRERDGMNGRQMLVIAAGAIVGATVIGSPMRRGASLLGAVAGGLLANWWYERTEPLSADPARRGL